MKRSYVETFFRHRVLLIAPVIIALVLAAGYGLTQPRKYVASATIWTDRRIPADSAIGTLPGADVPSAGQMALLTSLLTTRSFMYTVIQHSSLASELQGSRLDVDLTLARLASTISVATPGPQVMAIAVKQPSPEAAVGLATAVVRQFMQEELRRINSRAKAQMDYDRKQSAAADDALRKANALVVQYTRTHPGAANDPTDQNANTLAMQVALAQQQASEASKALTGSRAAADAALRGALEVLDSPNQAVPQARKKVVIFSGVGGLIAGLSISVLALLLLTARDGAVRAEDDLQRALGLRVAGTIGEFPKRRRLAFASRRAEAPVAVTKGPS